MHLREAKNEGRDVYIEAASRNEKTSIEDE